MYVTLVDPKQCCPPHKISHPEKMRQFANKFVVSGWGDNQEALVGYYIGSTLQLLSGTHRHGASLLAGLNRIPVIIKKYDDVQNAVGDLDRWSEIMRTSKCII